MVKNLLLYAFIFLLVYPYVFLLSHLKGSLTWDQELTLAFRGSFLQASTSAILTLVIGFIASLGLLTLKDSKKFFYFQMACLLPSFLPALFFVLPMLAIIKPFPYGIGGIIITHVMLCMGLAGVVFCSLFGERLQMLAQTSFLEGAHHKLFWMTSLRSLKKEIFLIFIFFFVYFFTSFSVPLLVGGRSFTVETLIFEKLRGSGSLAIPVWINFIETIFLFLMLFFYRSFPAKTAVVQQGLEFYGYSGLKYLVLIPVFIYFAGSLIGLLPLLKLGIYIHPNLILLITRSLIISSGVGVALICYFTIVLLNFEKFRFQKWLLSYIPLSTILFAMSFLFLPLNLSHLINQDLQVILSLSILFFPALYRMQFQEKMDALKRQYQVAELMGANPLHIFNKILFPQIRSTLFFLSGLGAFWSIGDFAVSRVIYGQEKNLAIFIQNMMNQYRFENAIFYEIVLLLCGLLIFFIFSELKYVFNKKS